MKGTFDTPERTKIRQAISRAESLAKLAAKDVYEAKVRLRDREAELTELRGLLTGTPSLGVANVQ